MTAQTRAKAKWKVGDWCYWDFQLSEVLQVDKEGRVSNLSNGYISGGAYDNRPSMVPVTLQNKVIAEAVEHAKEEVREAESGVGLNWPDIAREFEQLWLEYVDAAEAGVADAWKPVHDFKLALLQAIKNQRAVKIGNLRVFGR